MGSKRLRLSWVLIQLLTFVCEVSSLMMRISHVSVKKWRITDSNLRLYNEMSYQLSNQMNQVYMTIKLLINFNYTNLFCFQITKVHANNEIEVWLGFSL